MWFVGNLHFDRWKMSAEVSYKIQKILLTDQKKILKKGYIDL
jgi:hypothetical protein